MNVKGSEYMKDSYINTKDLAAYLSVTERHIVNLRNDKGLPFVKVGKVFRYKLAAIEEWLNNKE